MDGGIGTRGPGESQIETDRRLARNRITALRRQLRRVERNRAVMRAERERAALAWAEAVTLVAEGHVPDEVYAEALQQFSEEELVNLTMAVVTINGWNRLSVAFRVVPGEYQPAARKAEGGTA